MIQNEYATCIVSVHQYKIIGYNDVRIDIFVRSIEFFTTDMFFLNSIYL